MAHIDQQVQLVAEPLDHLDDLARLVGVLLLAPGRLRQPLLDFLRLMFSRPRRQPGGVPGEVFAEVGHRPAQVPGQDVEDLAQLAQVRLTAEHFHKAGDVPVVGDAGHVAEAEQPIQGRVAAQLVEAAAEAGVTQGHGEDDDAPEHGDRKVVAAATAGLFQAVEQLLIGEDLQQLSQGGQLRVVFQPRPGEQGIGRVQPHGHLRGQRAGDSLESKGYPWPGEAGVKKRPFNGPVKAKMRRACGF